MYTYQHMSRQNVNTDWIFFLGRGTGEETLRTLLDSNLLFTPTFGHDDAPTRRDEHGKHRICEICDDKNSSLLASEKQPQKFSAESLPGLQL